MRRLNRKQQTLKIVKEMDAFPKVPESYTETTSTGGTGNIRLLLKCVLRGGVKLNGVKATKP